MFQYQIEQKCEGDRQVKDDDFGKNIMSKEKDKFNVTQGMTLLLLKKLSLPANLVFLMILFITNPVNKIGYEDE